MNLIWTALVGIIAGALAKFIMPGKDPGGIWITMARGVAGAFVILAVYPMIKGRAAKPA